MLNRSTDDEMARITERGSQHAAAAWLRVANHAVLAEDQLHARQQVWQYYHTMSFMPAPLAFKMPHPFTNNSTVSDIYINTLLYILSIDCHLHNHCPGCSCNGVQWAKGHLMRNMGFCPTTNGFRFGGSLGFHVESRKFNPSSPQFDPPEPRYKGQLHTLCIR